MSTTTKRRERAFATHSAQDVLRTRAALVGSYPAHEASKRIEAKRDAEKVLLHAALVYFTSERAASCAGSHKRVTPL
jgi:hypothetical protein